MIRAGDTVRHKPTNETWVVCGVDGDSLIPCGYPFPTIALVSDCELVERGEGQTEDMKRALYREGLYMFVKGGTE